MKSQTEIETKFDVDDDVVVTDLRDSRRRGVSRGARRVRPRRPVLRHQRPALAPQTSIVLRRRLGGDDEGWHVKFERAPGERTEIHEPVGDDPTEIPESLLDLLVLHCHDAELVPVAEVRNHRVVHRSARRRRASRSPRCATTT